MGRADHRARQRPRVAGAEGHGVRVLVHEVADLAHVAFGQDAAVVDEEDAARHRLHLVQDVARHEHGAALASEALHEVHHAAPVHGVHPAQRLVEQQHLGVVGEGLRHLDALAHPLAVAADLAVARLGAGRPAPGRAPRGGGTPPRRSR